MAQTAVKVFFHARHDGFERELNHWLSQISGQVAVKGISVDSKYGHCLAIMYEAAEQGRHDRGHVPFSTNHSRLEQEATDGLTRAEAYRGRSAAIGSSNEYRHALCVVEERSHPQCTKATACAVAFV